jgi:HEPN domain-containing protein
MISNKDLRAIGRARLRDAQVLLRAKRFDGSYYLCGYAVELVLKARICRTLRWPGFPESAQDFKGFQLLKTHDLEILLRFSGAEVRVKSRYMSEWSEVLKWHPEKRYQAIGQLKPREAADMIRYVERLLTIL